jgi:hypothetical protein
MDTVNTTNAKGTEMNTETITMPATETLSVLTSESREGDFVHEGQEMASGDGFRNVSKLWFDKTLSFEQGLAQIEAGRAQTEDIMATGAEMVGVVNEQGKFAFRHVPSDRLFRPTEHAIRQVGGWAETGTWVLENLLAPLTNNKGRVLAERDAEDAETLAKLVNNGFRRLEAGKKFLFRTRKDGTLRAMLSDRYAIVDNRWFVDLLHSILPDARLSHWRGDSDTLWGNLLIPDTIRAEQDSEYGGMLSIGNSEIGERRVSSMPSIFRAICMNGCIWGQTKGQGIRQVHRGKIDLNELANEIRENLKKQIPLLPAGIDKLLALREHEYTLDTKVFVAALARDYKLSKKQASAVLDAWNVERVDTPELSKTLFCVTNSVTRAGQKFSNAEWLKFDEIGGELTGYKAEDFARLVAKGESLSVKDVEDTFA